MMRYGIPEYRLPRNILDAEIDRLRGLGIVFTQNHKIKDLLAEQKEGGFDAVFVAIGAHLSKRVDIPSMDAGKMIDAVSFLHDVASGERPVIGRRVAVYGGGNTAMDAARVARRLGAEESIVIYRRGEEQMPANAAEKEEAIREGVQMNWLRTISAMDSDSMTVEIMELDGHRVGVHRRDRTEPVHLDALADGLFLLRGVGGHLLLAAAVDDDRLLGTEPARDAGGIHRCVATL